MLAEYRVCRSDEDYAQYALFFIRHRQDFSRHFSLADALMHTLETIQTSTIVLVIDKKGQTIGWAHYRYMTPDGEAHPEGEIAFVDSAITTEAHRSSRLFVEGFRHLVHHMAAENRGIRVFQFHALADNAYLTRLYSKFARIIGRREGYHGTENLFSADFAALLHYVAKYTKSQD
ncbi:GNAT family N-acetyltransferase [Paenibacillus tyrfis]|uniref:GNAT family N-acetyltransferase n=1 Tax=Paenibacillus tyrfis TaxID=1501230 RepID=UPI0020A13E06|nr:GNAT family N-acetyltransferase [Paenibacillus tyrfis]MCP1309984.1 GNAT family N-acetyltransferase [Paenibacillus tyrfis]